MEPIDTVVKNKIATIYTWRRDTFFHGYWKAAQKGSPFTPDEMLKELRLDRRDITRTTGPRHVFMNAMRYW